MSGTQRRADLLNSHAHLIETAASQHLKQYLPLEEIPAERVEKRLARTGRRPETAVTASPLSSPRRAAGELGRTSVTTAPFLPSFTAMPQRRSASEAAGAVIEVRHGQGDCLSEPLRHSFSVTGACG